MERIQVKAFIGNKSPNIQVKTCGETWRSWRLRVQESERIEGTKNSQWSKKCWSVQYNSWAAKQVFLLCLCLLSFSEEKICLGKATVVRNVRKWSKSPRVEAKERRRRQVKWVWNELKSLKCAKKRVQKGVWILSWQYLAVLLYYLVLSCICSFCSMFFFEIQGPHCARAVTRFSCSGRITGTSSAPIFVQVLQLPTLKSFVVCCLHMLAMLAMW